MTKILVVLFFVALMMYGFIKRDLIATYFQNFYESTILKHSMKLTSLAFANNTPIPAKYSCDAEGINPPLTFSDIPGKAESLALIVSDPDAPGGDFIHWVLFHIPPTTSLIDENSIPPDAISGLNSLGAAEWTSPCPPTGTHRYVFTLYALDTQITGGENMTKALLLARMKDHILDTATLVGTYQRQENN